MEVVGYRENQAGNSTLYMDFELKGEEFSAEYRNRTGPTAGIRIENSDETIYAGSVNSLHAPSNQDELMDHVEEAFAEMLSPEIAEELLENPENVHGMPQDEIVYKKDNEFNLPKR